MRLLEPWLIFIALLLSPFPLFGQETAQNGTVKETAQNENAEQPQTPAIKGQWSEPVNGIRMMAKYLQRDTPTDEIHLLVFMQNCTEKPIDVPNLKPEAGVMFKDSAAKSSDGNLRVTVEQLGDKRKLAVHQVLRAGGLKQLDPAVEPGEIRLHSICLQSTSHLMQKMREDDGISIPTDSVVWPHLNHASSKGRWKISLSWRPDREFPVDEDLKVERLEKRVVDTPEQWRSVQIDLPPLELDWEPQTGKPMQKHQEQSL